MSRQTRGQSGPMEGIVLYWQKDINIVLVSVVFVRSYVRKSPVRLLFRKREKFYREAPKAIDAIFCFK